MNDEKLMRDLCVLSEQYIQNYNNLKRFQRALSIETNPMNRQALMEKIVDLQSFINENIALYQQIFEDGLRLI